MSKNRVIVTKPYPGITVYDNVFSWYDNKSIDGLTRTTQFALGWSDIPGEEVHFHSSINSEEWEYYSKDPGASKYLDILANSKPFKDFTGRGINQSVINCDTIADSHSIHTHVNQDVILYYINTEWKDAWAGETFFFTMKPEKM